MEENTQNTQPETQPQQLSKKEARALKREQKEQQRSAIARKQKTKTLLVWGGIIVGLAVIIGAWVAYSKTPGPYDDFAKCINDSGATFYGAFWCPHCQNQKQAFGRSEKYLPYIECSLPSGQGQTGQCTQANIESYPTWEFSDGSRLTGELSFETLAEKTGCALPE